MRPVQSVEKQAERLKAFFRAACEEVGLEVRRTASSILVQTGSCLVACFVDFPDSEVEDPAVVVAATISGDRPWPARIHIWSAVKTGSQRVFLHGRESVRPLRLVQGLLQTVHERDVVKSAIDAGVSTPYWFNDSVWSE